jgi:predicted nucleotidyltransferase
LIRFEKTLIRLDEFCKKISIKYVVIGGVAVITYDYQRTTKDIDITVLCNLEDLETIHDKFIQTYLPVHDDSLNFFAKNFLLSVKDKTTDIKIDVAAGLTIFDETIIKRRKRTKLGKAEFYICTLEDLIIYKLFAKREQDIADIKHLVEKNLNSIDKNYLLETAEKFKELEREDIIENLNELFTQ